MKHGNTVEERVIPQVFQRVRNSLLGLHRRHIERHTEQAANDLQLDPRPPSHEPPAFSVTYTYV